VTSSSTSHRPFSDLRILAQEGNRYFKYAKVDSLEAGNGLLIYDYHTGEKISRHSDGKVYTRVAGSGARVPPSTSVPFSQIQREVVRSVSIPSDATQRMSTYSGNTQNCFIFSSTVLSSNGAFAAEIVDLAALQPALEAWKHHPDYVSAQTYRGTGTGKAVILTVLNKRI
jgi:hypothetical protein